MILILGASGQLGTELVRLARLNGVAHRAMARPEFDFSKPELVASCFAEVTPRIVINAAAYTAVDAAEGDEPAARAANEAGPAQLAAMCAQAGIPLMHVSTDYVFDGQKGEPYVERDPTNPTGVYGRTKRDGELAILASGGPAVILRTSWVYAAHGKNFVRTMMNAARQGRTLRVVADQRGTPTSAVALAETILAVIAQIKTQGWQERFGGVFHATNTGETSWHGFATEIFRIAAEYGQPMPDITPITTADWPTPARRPADSRLDCSKLRAVFGLNLPAWEASLRPVVAAILGEVDATKL